MILKKANIVGTIEAGDKMKYGVVDLWTMKELKSLLNSNESWGDAIKRLANKISFTKMSKKHCNYNKFTNLYNSLESAKVACGEKGKDCIGIYDQFGKGNKFYLCKAGKNYGSSTTSIIYNVERR